MARQQLHVTTHDKRQQNRQGLETNVLSATNVDTHLEPYMVAEQVRETGDLRLDVLKVRERIRCRLC